MGAFEALTISSHRLCRWYLTPFRLGNPKSRKVPLQIRSARRHRAAGGCGASGGWFGVSIVMAVVRLGR
jgi:hypothetical protein